MGITTKATLLSTAHLRSQGQGVKLNSEQSRRGKTTQREKKKVKEKRGMEMEKKRMKDAGGRRKGRTERPRERKKSKSYLRHGPLFFSLCPLPPFPWLERLHGTCVNLFQNLAAGTIQ